VNNYAQGVWDQLGDEMHFGRGDALEGEQSSPCSAPWWRDAFQLVEEVELIAGSHRVNEIERALPGISRSLLASRLRHLHDAGVVERLQPCG
jgi:HxlR-like helix-turn-helix